jgi:hypothetical protein
MPMRNTTAGGVGWWLEVGERLGWADGNYFGE